MDTHSRIAPVTPIESHRPTEQHQLLEKHRPPESGAPPTVLRCESTADFLAALPFITGFTDQHSLFAVLFHGKRAGDVLRIDLPAADDRTHADAFLDGVISLMQQSGAGAASPALVFMTAESFAQQGGVPWLGLAKRLERRFRREGWVLRELAVVARDGWCGLLSPDGYRARPLSEIFESPLAAQARATQDEPRALDEVGRLPQPARARATAVKKHLLQLEHRRAAASAHPAGAAERCNSAHLLGAARVADACFPEAGPSGAPAATHQPIEARELARLIDVAQVPDLWLVLALTILTRAEFVATVATDDEHGRLIDIPIDVDVDVNVDDNDAAEVDSDLNHTPGREATKAWSIKHLLFALSHDPPELRRLRQASTVLEDATAHAPRDRQPALLALLAWVWWMRGMQSVSHRLITQSLEIDPDNQLTLMVQQLNAAPSAAHLHRLRSSFDAVA